MAIDACDPVDQMKFKDMNNQIHVDEKWFFLKREKERYLLHQDEKNLKCCVKHKSHITKVMFLCAVARPRFNPCSNSWWDSELGVWPIGHWEPAKPKLKNRPKGTLLWKNQIVTKEVDHDLLITKLVPSILEKWPRRDRLSRSFFIQQDGQKLTLGAMISYSMTHWLTMASMQHPICKQRTHLMLIYWLLVF